MGLFKSRNSSKMKIQIEIRGAKNKEQIVHMKKFMEKERINGLEKIKVDRTINNGEMGGGVIGTLTAVLIGVAGPFSRFAESFTKYATSFRTEIILKNEYGDELVLNTKKLDKEAIHTLVEKFLEKKPQAANSQVKAKG